MLGHVATAWGIITQCAWLVIRAGVLYACVAELMHSKPERKRGNRYAGLPQSLQAQVAQTGYLPEMRRRERTPRRRRRS